MTPSSQRRALPRGAGVFLTLALVAMVALMVAGRAPATADEPGIVGGGDADQAYPFVASLQSDSGAPFCAGSVVAPRWLVTAAHCVVARKPGAVTARVGSNDRTTGGQVRAATDLIPHPEYDRDAAGSDIALVRLAEPVNAAPIQVGSTAEVGTATRLLGWGQTCPTPGCADGPTILQQLDTSIVDGAECPGAVPGFAEGLELCTDNPGGDAGSCYGDSGGPQITKVDGTWRLLGVTSRAGNTDPTCATAPSIYTSVVAYTEWIVTQIAPSPATPPGS